MRPVSTIKCNKKPFNKNTILLCLARPGKVATNPAGWSARAFRFVLLMKKRRVACGPIVSDTPARNISCPRTPFFSGAQKAPRLSKAGTGCVELSPGSLETEQAALAETQWRDGTAHTTVELLALFHNRHTFKKAATCLQTKGWGVACQVDGGGAHCPGLSAPCQKRIGLPGTRILTPGPSARRRFLRPERIPSVGCYALAYIQHAPDTPV